jgi:hypothetical protein
VEAAPPASIAARPFVLRHVLEAESMSMMMGFSVLSRTAVAATAFLAWHDTRAVSRSTAEGLQEPRPSVAGTWQINDDKTEKYDARVDRDIAPGSGKTVDHMPSARASGGGGRTRSAAGSGGSSGTDAADAFGGGAGATLDRRASNAFREATRAPRELRIEQTDTSVTIVGGAKPLTVLTNGKVVTDSTVEGEVSYSIKAQWKKDQLVIERQMGRGTSIRSTYYLDKKDPKTLIVDVRFESKAMSRTVDNRRVYNAMQGS